MFHHSDDITAILYMRYLKESAVLRVARVVPSQGVCLALYPSGNADYFWGEAFREVDDNSVRQRVPRKQIEGNQVWIRLLDGEKREDILKDYEPSARDIYYLIPRGETPDFLRTTTFRIAEDRNEEDIQRESQERASH